MSPVNQCNTHTHTECYTEHYVEFYGCPKSGNTILQKKEALSNNCTIDPTPFPMFRLSALARGGVSSTSRHIAVLIGGGLTTMPQVRAGSCCGTLCVQSASYSSSSASGTLQCSLVLRKDIRKGDRGESRRLTFEERAERRMGKTREQKASKEQLEQEAQTMVAVDFPEELEALYATTAEKANISAMKVLNMAKCLELLEVEVAGGHAVLLTKIAQVVKTGPSTLEVVPNNASFGSAILQRVSRFDGSLQVSKEGPKIMVGLPPVTTARRDKTVAEVQALTVSFRQKVKQARTHMGKVLQDSGLDDNMQEELKESLDSTVNSFVEEKAAELELLAEEVMTMGIDESDAAVA